MMRNDTRGVLKLSSLATRTIFRKAEIVDIQRFQLFFISVIFIPWTLFLKKQAYLPCFNQFCEQKQDITQSGFHCRVSSIKSIYCIFNPCALSIDMFLLPLMQTSIVSPFLVAVTTVSSLASLL